MNRQIPRTLWLVGTSVSIEESGYAARLRRGAEHDGISFVNLSVGDQTSVMGCMRLFSVCETLAPGDIVVWEYGLLDTLLTRPGLASDDVHSARRLAWKEVLQRGAALIVVLVAPQRYARRRSACERVMARDARELGLPCVDSRELFATLGITRATEHYRDDRHPREDSPVIHALSLAIREHASVAASPASSIILAWARKRIAVRWQWLGAKALADLSDAPVHRLNNALLSIETVRLEPGMAMRLPAMHRLIGIGCASTHATGGLWCGHQGCPPASLRLPAELPYRFLLRSSGLGCLRRSCDRIVSAPTAAYASGVWHDYGQEPSAAPGAVDVLGLLYEIDASPRQRLRSWLRALRRRARIRLTVWRTAMRVRRTRIAKT